MRHLVTVDKDKCIDCGFCEEFVDCPSSESGCIGCGTCIKGCPQECRTLKRLPRQGDEIRFKVDGIEYGVEGPITIRDALVAVGIWDRESHDSWCDTGGCWSCAVLADGELVRSCVTALRDQMDIITDPCDVRALLPKRIVTVTRPPPHYCPSMFLHGCNYQCGICHNWDLTFSSTGRAVTPIEAVRSLGLRPGRDLWVGISGGEPTLNRSWLVQVVREIRSLGGELRIQVDTNASLLTPDYIDELVAAGMTDLSPDLKSYRLETFMKLTGITSEEKASSYLQRSWEAVRYVRQRYREDVFIAVSFPYHPNLISLEELEESARALVSIDPDIPVTLIEYQPAFRARHWPFAKKEQMELAKRVVISAGLKKVIVQGGAEVPLPVDPAELLLSSEEF